MRTDTVREKVSHDTKVEAERILGELGLSMSEAINLMLIQVKLRHRLPFDIAMPNMPNEETQRALDETDKAIGLIHCKDADDFFQQMGM